MDEMYDKGASHVHLGVKEETKCPSCGRFVGAYERCPYCQASMGMRMSLKLVRRISVFGSLLGLLLLYAASRAHEIPTVQVGKLQMNNNMALVKVRGSVAEVNVDEVRNNFRINLNDGTGRITLNAFGKLDVFQRQMGENFPREGDVLEAVGNLSISEQWGTSMFLTSPRRIGLVERPQVTDMKIGSITEAFLSKQVWLEGQIAESSKFKSGYTLLLRDDTGSLSLTVFNRELDEMAKETGEALIVPGNRFKIRAKVDKYREDLQLRIADTSPEAVKFLGTAKLPEMAAAGRKVTPLGDVPHTKEDAVITIAARVKSKKVVENVGISLVIDDATGEETMFIYNNQLEKIPDIGLLDRGKNVTVRGLVKVKSYRGKRQLVPLTGDAITIGEAP